MSCLIIAIGSHRKPHGMKLRVKDRGIVKIENIVAVSYTHLDVYKRQGLTDEDEAHLFVTQEENVTKLTQYDKFIAACASGEEHGCLLYTSYVQKKGSSCFPFS